MRTRKLTLLAFAAIAALATSCCNDELNNNNNQKGIVINATAETPQGGIDTRLTHTDGPTSMDDVHGYSNIDECTVSPADSHAVIRALPEIMADIMAEGRVVHLDDFGSFYFTCQSTGKGVDTAEKVSSNQITSVRVQFIPYRERKGTVYTRAMVSNPSFTEWLGKEPENNPGGNTSGGSDGDEEENPLG